MYSRDITLGDDDEDDAGDDDDDDDEKNKNSRADGGSAVTKDCAKRRGRVAEWKMRKTKLAVCCTFCAQPSRFPSLFFLSPPGREKRQKLFRKMSISMYHFPPFYSTMLIYIYIYDGIRCWVKYNSHHRVYPNGVLCNNRMTNQKVRSNIYFY